MALASIMVHVDFDDEAENRIGVAAGLAGRFNAVLIGIAGWPLRKKLVVADSVVDFETTDQGQQQIAKQLDRLGARFRQIVGANPRGMEWRSHANFPSEVIVGAARAADLVVIGREALPGDVYHTFDPGTVVLGAGRPVLVVPSGIHQLPASRITIAWKGTREARRAVVDALPFLKEAQSVGIVEVTAPGMEAHAREEIADVARYLGRHDVTVGSQTAVAAAGSESDALLQLATEQGADLIVAGAYGRTRLREWIFGGVTRDLLMTSRVPCLFSN
jgi:nucleotide-binding universal stress UspA family protein